MLHNFVIIENHLPTTLMLVEGRGQR